MSLLDDEVRRFISGQTAYSELATGAGGAFNVRSEIERLMMRLRKDYLSHSFGDVEIKHATISEVGKWGSAIWGTRKWG